MKKIREEVRKWPSQWAFSQAAGIEPSYLSKMLNGRKKISAVNMARIQKALLRGPQRKTNDNK